MHKPNPNSLFPLLALVLSTTLACSSDDPTSATTVACAPGCAPTESCVSGVCQPANGDSQFGNAGAPDTASLAGTPNMSAAGAGNETAGQTSDPDGAGAAGMGAGVAGTAGMTADVAAGAGAAGTSAMAGTSGAAGADVGAAGADVGAGTGNAGAPSGDETAGATPAGSGGAETSEAGATSVDDPAPSGAWHGAVSETVTAATLQSEYDSWKAAHVVQCDNGTASVDKGDGRVVSEGIAYGMLLSANMDDRTLFDQLWQFYNDHLDSQGLMNWDWSPPCAAPGNNNTNAATDAEMDALMALLQANQRWPDGTYLAEAEALALKVLEFEVEECDGRTILRPGDRFGGCSDMFNQRINPSYFSPGYYRAFAFHFPAQAPTWNALLEGTYELYAGYEGAASDGPYPDWSNTDGSANGSGYSYDAARTPWRIATDYAWSAEPRAAAELARVVAFVDAAGGIPVGSKDNNSTFSGAFALAAIPDQPKFDQYMEDWMAAGGDDRPYFQGTLRVLYLLLAGGHFPSTF